MTIFVTLYYFIQFIRSDELTKKKKKKKKIKYIRREKRPQIYEYMIFKSQIKLKIFVTHNLIVAKVLLQLIKIKIIKK
jgi:hypothetical protein